jgi:hypothetical protein
MGIPGRASMIMMLLPQGVSPVTPLDYVLALCSLLGTLLFLAAIFYVAICVKRKRHVSALQRQVP